MDRLIDGGRRFGLSLGANEVACFRRFSEQLLEWNTRFNLTAITEPEQVEIRHFLDSLSCLQALTTVGDRSLSNWLSRPLNALDIGAGAGLPGIPLKIVWPRLRLTLLEATGKKVRFLEHVIEELSLSQTLAVHDRAESLAHDPQHRDKYDFVLVRSVAELPVLLEYALPFARRGGLVLAQKGEAAAAEVVAAEQALAILGGQLRQVVPVEIPGLADTRHLVVVEKKSQTPEKYPRRPGMPQKRPL